MSSTAGDAVRAVMCLVVFGRQARGRLEILCYAFFEFKGAPVNPKSVGRSVKYA